MFQYQPNAFDCIILDEAHHSSNNIYTKVINYFNPKLFLGMTATPDKRDDNQEGKNIYEIFHYQIAHEIRLQQAMEDNLLCPFHYFGISEVVSLDDKTLQAAKLTDEEFNQLTSDERVRHVIEQSEYYGYSGDRVRGLIFCSRVKECEELSRKFNALGYRTIALSGADNEEKRQEAFERLAMDEADATEEMQPLDYIFSRDILNEGVDIVEVNQVIMLRPTQSPIVFIQQLGRGLRKAPGKEYVVILDFIGNYNETLLLPILRMYGDRIIFITAPYDRTLNYISAEFLKYCSYINVSHFSQFLIPIEIKEDPLTVNEEPYRLEIPNKQGRYLRILNKILLELSLEHFVTSVRIHDISDDDALSAELIYSILPFCTYVCNKQPMRLSETLQKYIDRCPYIELIGEWFIK